MQPLPMASSPDGLISARYAVITKTPGWEVLTTTSNVNGRGGGGGMGPKGLCTKNGSTRFSSRYMSFFPETVTLVCTGGGGGPPSFCGVRPFE